MFRLIAVLHWNPWVTDEEIAEVMVWADDLFARSPYPNSHHGPRLGARDGTEPDWAFVLDFETEEDLNGFPNSAWHEEMSDRLGGTYAVNAGKGMLDLTRVHGIRMELRG
jgi:hypothetical protein